MEITYVENKKCLLESLWSLHMKREIISLRRLKKKSTKYIQFVLWTQTILSEITGSHLFWRLDFIYPTFSTSKLLNSEEAGIEKVRQNIFFSNKMNYLFDPSTLDLILLKSSHNSSITNAE